MKLRKMVLASLAATAVAGCGGDDTEIADVDAGVDAAAAIDATAVDAGPAVGTCTAKIGTGALMGIAMVFHDPSGTPLATVATDATGTATYDSCIEGGMITMVNPQITGETQNLFVTYQGVNPGDTVQLGRPDSPPVGTGIIDVQLTSPAEGGVLTGVISYEGRFGTCATSRLTSSTGGTITVNNPDPCLGDDPTNFAVLGVALDDGSSPVGFSRGTSDSSIPVTGGAWVAHAGASVVTVDVPPSLLGGEVSLKNLIDGVNFGSGPSQSLEQSPTAIDLDAYPAAVVDGYLTQIQGFWTDQSIAQTRMRTSTAPTSLAVGDLLFASIFAAGIDVSETARPQVEWLGGDPSAMYSTTVLFWQSGGEDGVWLLVGPEGEDGSLRVPAMPDAYASDVPLADSIVEIGYGVIQIGADWMSYAEFLAKGADFNELFFGGLILPADSTLRIGFWLAPNGGP